MYHNVEKRSKHPTTFPSATYRGWDGRGRLHFIGKGGARGQLWWAQDREKDLETLFGTTLREISEKLAVRK